MMITMIVRIATFALVVLAIASFANAQDTAEEIRATLDKAKITAADAIQKAKEQVKEGVLVDLELEEHNGIPEFEAEFHDGTALIQVKLNAITGEVMRINKKEIPEDRKDAEKQRGDELREAAAGVKLDLANALKVAEEATGGRPFEIKMKVRDGKLIADIRTVTAEKLREALIDVESNTAFRVKDREKR